MKKSKTFDPGSAELPEWLSRDLWTSWVQYRRDIRKPIRSPQTVTQSLRLLEKQRDNGHSPEDIIQQSIAQGWCGLFEPSKAPQTARKPSIAEDFSSKDYGETVMPSWAMDD